MVNRKSWIAFVGLMGLAVSWNAAQAASPCQKESKKPVKGKIVRVTYPVADLVIPVGSHAQGKAPVTTEEELIGLIQSTIAPASWAAKGGTGTVDYYPLSMALVVNHTRDQQEEIADLLAALRRLHDLSVCLETRIIEMNPDLAEQFIREGGFQETKQEGSESSVKTAFLDDGEMRQWLSTFQGNKSTNVLQAPKMTVFNGQDAEIQTVAQQSYVTDYKVTRSADQVVVAPHKEVIETGMRCAFLPVVSADRRFVRLNLAVKMSELTGPVSMMPVTIKVVKQGEEKECQGFVAQPNVQTLAVKSTCVVPEGRTVVFPLGQKLTEARTEYGPPVLTKVPYVNRLFKNVGYGREERAVFVFVTPRILVQEEEEVPAAKKQ